MPGKIWATEAQLAYLMLQLPDYIRRQAQKKLHLFWGAMIEGFFARFPEQSALGLPLASDAEARPLTAAEAATLSSAITARKDQLRSWFRRAYLKTRNGSTGKKVKKLSPLAQILAKKKVPKGRRAHRETEVFQQRNAAAIRDKLTELGHDDVNEAARRQRRRELGQNNEETLEMQEEEVKTARKERMELRTAAVAELWEDATPEEREAVRKQVELEKKELARLRKEEGKEEGDDLMTAEKYQEGVDGLDELFETVHSVCLEGAGWVGVTLLGGPTPRLPGGETTVKVICGGETPAGNSFQEACADFESQILGPWKLFVDRCYTIAQCAARAIEAPPTPPAPAPALVVAPPNVVEPNVNTPAPRPKPKRVPKPKKTVATIADSSAFLSVPATPPSTQASAETLATPLVETPSALADLTPALAFASSAQNLGAVSWTATPPATEDTHGDLFTEDTDDLSFATDFLHELGMGFFDQPATPTAPLDSRATTPDHSPVPSPEHEPSGTNTMLRWDEGSTGSTGGFDVAAFAVPTAAPTAAGSTQDTARPRPRPAYKGTSIYAPSTLFSAFTSPRRKEPLVPLVPAASPASLRRKLTGWTSPLKQPGRGGITPTRTGTTPTRTATVLAQIVGAPLPATSTSALPATSTFTPPVADTVTSPPAQLTAPPTSTFTFTPPATSTSTPPAAATPPPATAPAAGNVSIDIPICRPAAKPLKPPAAAKKPGPRRGRPPKRNADAAAEPATASTSPTATPTATPTSAPASAPASASPSSTTATTSNGALGDASNQDLGTIHQMRPGMGTSRWNKMVEQRQRQLAEAKEAAAKEAELAKSRARGYYETPNPNGDTPTIVLTSRRATKARVMFDGTTVEAPKKGVRQPKTGVDAGTTAGSKRKAPAEENAAGSRRKAPAAARQTKR